MTQNTGIIICSRSDSKRIPNKPFVQINGTPLLEHLIQRIIPTGLPIVIAVPDLDFDLYSTFAERFSKKQVTVMAGSASDPLARMSAVAERLNFDTVVRICHDKIFIEPSMILRFLKMFDNSRLDYLYSSSFTEGSGFEVISASALALAAATFKNVEHIGYAICSVTKEIYNFDLAVGCPVSKHRLLIDYPDDLKVMEVLFSTLGNNCSLKTAIDFLDHNSFIAEINRLPIVSVYTCAYNADKWIQECMGSVAAQKSFNSYEYILVDDFSSDKTTFHMSQFCSVYKNAKWIRNKFNMGLASSSNVALSQARGRYILRLDADDFFTNKHSLMFLIKAMEDGGVDIVYPNNYFGCYTKIQAANESHHVGGTLFRTRAANYVKFTDGLRGYDGYDFFERAKGTLKIGYLDKPIFFYRQHDKSLSKEPNREAIKKGIDESIKKGD